MPGWIGISEGDIRRQLETSGLSLPAVSAVTMLISEFYCMFFKYDSSLREWGRSMQCHGLVGR